MAQAPQYAIAVADLRRHDGSARQAALAATRHAQLQRTAALEAWPYFVVEVSLLEGDAACIHLCFDLMLVDSTSIGLLLTELGTLYQQPHAALPVAGLSFRDYQRAVALYQATPAYSEQLADWQRKFAALPGGPALPQLAPGAAPAITGAHQRVDGTLAHWPGLVRQAQACGVAQELVLLTAYLEVLHAWNGGQSLSVVVPGWERLPVHPDIARVVGDFTALSWVTRGAETLTLAQRLAQVARQHADDLAQRPASGLQALRRVMLRDRQRRLAFPVVFTNHIAPLAPADAPFLPGAAQSRTPQVCLDNLSRESLAGLHCSWDFDGAVYAPAMIGQMFAGYLRLLDLLGSDPGAWQRTDFSDLIQASPEEYAATDDRSEGVS